MIAGTALCRDYPLELKGAFASKGFKERHFFPHRSYHLPKLGPDAFLLAERMCSARDVNSMWEVVVFIRPPVLDEFPQDLFFDDDVVWHQQQLGLPGQVASANLVIMGRKLYSMAHVSDVFQRISRRRALKTRVEKRLQGWSHMLLNSIMVFAIERGLEKVLVPGSHLALQHTDPSRRPDPELFTRIYDQHVSQPFSAVADGEWWSLDVRTNRQHVVMPVRRSHAVGETKTICVCHDIERGLGHPEVDSESAAALDASSRRHLSRALELESRAGVKASYSVVGQLLPEVRAEIEGGGSCLAFHSFDHRVDGGGRGRRQLVRVASRLGWGNPGAREEGQLQLCRHVDYRLKGYRPPQSRITPEISDRSLAFFNFEWLASSVQSLRRFSPYMRNRVVKLPILRDDFDLHTGRPYDDWEAEVLSFIDRVDFAAVSLHDCYGALWLPRYEGLLAELQDRGRLITLDAASSEVILGRAA